MSKQLERRSIIVTGGGSGIGRAAAILFGAEGASVTIADINEVAGKDTAALIHSRGGTARFTFVNLTQEEQVKRLVDDAVAAYGPLYGAFNNAGIDGIRAPVHEIPYGEWQKVIDVDLNAVFLCMKYEIAAMLGSGGGSIVNTSSGLAQVAMPGFAGYCSAKAGVLGLTKAAAVDYAKHNIRVNALLPGATLTPLVMKVITEIPGFEATVAARHPMNRFARPEEIAQAALWLLSEAASFVTGIAMPVDGGYLAM